MGATERWFWFEWICRLRDSYRMAEHATVVTIDGVIALAEHMLVADPAATDADVGSGVPPSESVARPDPGPFGG
jgi:hypothetical protein